MQCACIKLQTVLLLSHFFLKSKGGSLTATTNAMQLISKKFKTFVISNRERQNH